jgi:hypothetical protein
MDLMIFLNTLHPCPLPSAGRISSDELTQQQPNSWLQVPFTLLRIHLASLDRI